MSSSYAIPVPGPGPLVGREGARRAAGLCALAAMLAASAILAADAAAPNSFLLPDPGHTHRVPDWLAGPLSTIGVAPTAARFMLLLLALCGAYLVVLWCAPAIPARTAIAAIVGLHAIFLVAPPLLSTDVFTYIDYARLAVRHGLDPYASAPIAAPHDAIYPYVGRSWVHTTSAYGPLFTLVSYPAASLGVAKALWTLKALACAASLAMVALVGRTATVLGRPAVPAMLFVGINPLLLAYAVGGGHNDLFMMLLLTAGVWLVVTERAGRASAVVVAAAGIKASAGLALPFLVAGARDRRAALRGAAVAIAAVGAIALLAFGSHALSFAQVLGAHEKRLLSAESIPNEVARLFGLLKATSGVRLAAGVVALAVAGGLFAAVQRRRLDWISASGWGLLALVATATWIQAWYLCWPLPFAALSDDRRLRLATLGVAGVFVAHRLTFILV